MLHGGVICGIGWNVIKIILESGHGCIYLKSVTHLIKIDRAQNIGEVPAFVGKFVSNPVALVPSHNNKEWTKSFRILYFICSAAFQILMENYLPFPPLRPKCAQSPFFSSWSYLLWFRRLSNAISVASKTLSPIVSFLDSSQQALSLKRVQFEKSETF